MATLEEYLAQIRSEAPQGDGGIIAGYKPVDRVVFGLDGTAGYAPFDPITGKAVLQDNTGRWRYQVPGGTNEAGAPINAWGDYADYGFIPTEFNAAGDMYRVKTADPNRFYGGAGAGHEYDYYQYADPTADQTANGAWQLWNPGEHLEEEKYRWAGVNSQAYSDAFKNQFAGTTLSPLEQARLSMPGALGQAVTRSESSLTGGNNEDDARQELAFYMAQPGMMEKLQGVFTPAQMAAAQDQLSQSSASAQASRDTDDGFGDIMKLAALAAAIYAGGSALGAWGGLGEGVAAAAGTGAGTLGEGAALGSLGSGLSGVELAGAGLYGQTPLMTGSLGSGLAGTTAGTLGLDAGMLGAAGAGAAGAEALSSSSLPYGQTMAPITDVATLSGGTPYTSSLDSIINNAISTGSQGYPYTDPFSAGSITGISELGTPTGLYDYMASMGIDPAGLQAAAGGAGAAPATWMDTLANLFTPSPAGAGLSAAQQLLSEQLGIPSNIAGGALGGLQMLAAILGRNNQASANNAARQNQYSASYTAPLSPKPWAGAGRGKPLGQVIRRADGGLTQMLGTNNAGPGLGYVEGGSTGQADDVQALLSDGEYVLDADIVSALGDGNNAAGARVLDEMRENIRQHKRGAPVGSIPPKAKSIEQYLEGAR